MDIKIGEILKTLRKERGNTQEDLASHLGISVQAVSKWERGDGFPDITHLPYIASYYEATTDDLLGCNNLRKQNDLAEFEKKAQELINKGKRKERLALCREMQKKYPHEEIVLDNLMHDLFSTGATKNSEEIILIANKLLKSDSLEYRYDAIQMLAFTYFKRGDDEKAVEYAKMVPCNKDLLSTVLKGKDLVEHCRWYFWSVCDTMLRLSHNMMQCPEAGYTAEERHSIREAVYIFFRQIFPNGDFGWWENRLGRLCRDMAISSAEMGKLDQAFDELDKMCDHMEKYQRFTSIEHTSPLVRGLQYNASQSGSSTERSIACEFLCSLDEISHFQCLRTDARLESIKNRLQALG